MSLFIVFILLAVLLGAGAMLSPAWRTAQPRVALSATLCLALVMGGAVFYAEAFGWDPLVVDYLLFALLSGVVLGGTLSTAQARAEARGERLHDRDQGWPGPEDLAFFALVALVALIPLVNMPTPLGTNGQVIGAHSLAAREGEGFNSLAPLAPDEIVIVSPGFHALSAYLSEQLSQSIPRIQMSITAAVVFLLVWLAYDFGAELRDKRLGRSMAIAMLLCAGIQRSYLDGHFSEMLGLLFLSAFLLYALRLLRAFSLADLLAAGLMMGAVVYANLSLSIVMLVAFGTLLILVWTGQVHELTAKSRWGFSLGVPLVALLGIAPWLVNNWHLILPITPSPYGAELSNLAEMISGHGILIVILAIWGIAIGLRDRGRGRLVSLLMLLWLLLVLEAALIGLIGALLPPLGALTNAPSLARHGLILPMAWFAGLALLRLWETWLPAKLKKRLRRVVYPLMAGTAIGLLLLGTNFQALLRTAGPLLDLPPGTVTADDVAAMDWLRENTPADALLLAADGGGWLPVFAERRSLDFRALRYFEWDALTGAGGADDDGDFVFVPAGVDAPGELDLTLVFERGGARVFEVVER